MDVEREEERGISPFVRKTPGFSIVPSHGALVRASVIDVNTAAARRREVARVC